MLPKTYHISLLLQAIDNYDKSSVNGNMTIDEFIKINCKEILDNVMELED